MWGREIMNEGIMINRETDGRDWNEYLHWKYNEDLHIHHVIHLQWQFARSFVDDRFEVILEPIVAEEHDPIWIRLIYIRERQIVN